MLEGCTPWPQALARRYVQDGRWRAFTLASALERAARAHPRRVFLADRDGRLTYAEVDRLADRLAVELAACGLRAREIALVQLPNVREFALAFFALHKLGAIPVLCLPAHRRMEIAHFAAATGAAAHFFAPGFRGFDYVGMAREVQAEAPTVRLLVATGNGAEPGVRYLGPWLERASEPLDREAALGRHRPDPFDVAFMLLSGGTTGTPKLIPRTHADYLYNATECARVLAWGPDTRYMIGLPAAHNFALGAPGMVAALAVGGSVALAPSTDADELLGAIERDRATVLPVTPALLIQLLDCPRRSKYDLASLQQICVGGQRMLPELFDRLLAAFPHTEPIHAFGMAEGLTNLSRPDDPLALRRETQGRPVSPADEIRIVDDDGADVPAGAVGELITRGPYTIRGYYRGAEHDRAAFTADGYYRTGDLVRMHASGNLVVEGRRKDLINRGGEKISAEEVENLILGHEKVQMAAVVAMPDPVMGERACAFVVPKEGASVTLAEVNAFLLARQIAKFKLPERLEVVRAFPCTAMGKVSKKALRDEIAARVRAEHAGG
ncbi:MAG: AMP-binding protein [Burkholderiales bacterium]|nr:AMP-binding protein [Burkholderiales bacterium]